MRASRAFAVALATATPPARLRAGWRATKSKCDERSRGAKRRICVICVSFFIMPTPEILTLS
ncbi:MAG TPA: hypothetical protein O0Y06_04050 [Methanocorpusculum sp.]|nr:hypothetical protein [Methanocorpusculum sp.]